MADVGIELDDIGRRFSNVWATWSEFNIVRRDFDHFRPTFDPMWASATGAGASRAQCGPHPENSPGARSGMLSTTRAIDIGATSAEYGLQDAHSSLFERRLRAYAWRCACVLASLCSDLVRAHACARGGSCASPAPPSAKVTVNQRTPPPRRDAAYADTGPWQGAPDEKTCKTQGSSYACIGHRARATPSKTTMSLDVWASPHARKITDLPKLRVFLRSLRRQSFEKLSTLFGAMCSDL